MALVNQSNKSDAKQVETSEFDTSDAWLGKGRINSESEDPPKTKSMESSTRVTSMPEQSRSHSPTEWNGDEFIKVGVRVRPLTAKELATPVRSRTGPVHFRHKKQGPTDAYAWCVKGTDTIVQKVGLKVEGRTLFHFDSVFEESATTKQIYDTLVHPIVSRVAAGENGTFFCYGQTGSGKTHTMQGVDDSYKDTGIIQLVARELFNKIKEMSAERDYVVRISFIEIYNETVRDLLERHEKHDDDAESGNESRSRGSYYAQRSRQSVHSSGERTLVVREDPKRGGVYVNCKEMEVHDVKSIVDALHGGNQNRAFASTSMNDRSSRSHTIFRITLESREKASGNRHMVVDDGRILRISNLSLVDLAGSENGHHSSTGTRQREGGKINQSLLSLSQVIHSLSTPPNKRPAYVNYRNSKLTRLLQPYLSGNGLIAVLCCVTPSKLFVEETRSTLKFAARAKLVTTKPVINEILDDAAMIKKLQHDLDKARRHLKQLERREQLADQKTSEAKEEFKKLKGLIYGDDDLPDFESARTHHAALSSSHTAVKPPKSPVAKIPLAMRGLEEESTHTEVVSIPSLWDEDATQPTSTCNQEVPVSPSPANSRAQRSQVSPQSQVRFRAPPPSEVIIMREHVQSLTKDDQPDDASSRLRDSDERVEFLKTKLNTTENLVESLVKDVESARNCIHILVIKNVSLAKEIEKLKRKVRTAAQEAQGAMMRQHQMLKFCMYGGLFFFVCGQHELYFAAVMFLWLCLEVVT